MAAVIQRMNVRCGMRAGVFEVKPSKPTALRRITTGCGRRFRENMVSLGLCSPRRPPAEPRARLDVRAAAGRARADEWHGRDLFSPSPPHHRYGPTAARRPDTRQPRSAVRHVADRRGLAADGQTPSPTRDCERGTASSSIAFRRSREGREGRVVGEYSAADMADALLIRPGGQTVRTVGAHARDTWPPHLANTLRRSTLLRGCQDGPGRSSSGVSWIGCSGGLHRALDPIARGRLRPRPCSVRRRLVRH